MADIINTAQIPNKQEEYTELLKDILFIRANNSKPKALVRTYGCQQNVADSEKIKGMLEKMGCSFTQQKKALISLYMMRTIIWPVCTITIRELSVC